MNQHYHHQQIKIIGVNGQISLGRDFAGKTIMIDHISQDTWIIKLGEFVPASEKWLYQGDNLSKLERALERADKNPPVDNFDQLVGRIENESNKNRHE